MTDTRHLLVATDLSDRSERAMLRALQLAQGGHVTVLHVITAGLPADLGSRWQKDAEEFLAARVGGLSSAGSPDVETVVVAGNPFSTIIGEAAKRQAGVIVMGEPAGRGYADLFTGTTAERVVRFGDRPVLVVRRGPEPYKRVLAAFDGSEGAVRALKAALMMAPKAEFRIVPGARRTPPWAIRRWRVRPSLRKTNGSGL